MSASKKIIINTAASYGQSVISMVLTLFSARWVLLALGQTDYGLFGVVGSTILLMTLLVGGLSVGVSRFYAFSIGEGSLRSDDENNEDLKRWFNAALSIHIVLPLLILLIGAPIGDYAIRNWLTIPVERLDACLWVFRASLVSALATVFSVPFVAMFNAHQMIYVVSAFGILRSIVVFIIAWSLLHIDGDRLIAYAVGMSATGFVIQLMFVIAASRQFKACRVSKDYLFSWARIRKLFSFVGWKMFGMSCVALRAQGTPIVVNLYFGPIVNAAYTVAYSLSTQASSLSTAMTRAFQPAVVSAEGSGNREQMISMGMRVCKFGSLLVSIFAIPVIIEMEDLLQLWLVDPPEYAAPICQWLLAMLVVDRLTGGHMLAVNAYGKIAIYEFVQGALLLSAVPVMWVLFKMGYGPVSVGYALFGSMCVYCLSRIIFAKVLTGFPIIIWVKNTAIPMLLVIVASVASGEMMVYLINETLTRLILAGLVSVMSALLFAWILLFSHEEKQFIKGALQR